MVDLIIRDLSPDTERALHERAARHNRTPEAEVRAILDAVVQPNPVPDLGSALARIAARHGLTNDDLDALSGLRDRRTIEPHPFE